MRTITIVTIVLLLSLISVLGVWELVNEEWTQVPPKIMEVITNKTIAMKGNTFPEEGIFQVYEVTSEHFDSYKKAKAVYKKLKSKKMTVYYAKQYIGTRAVYAVKLGPFLVEQEAQDALKKALQYELEMDIEQVYLS